MAAGVGAAPPGPGPVLDEPDLPAVDLGAVQLLQGPLHVRVLPELDHALVLAALVGVGVGHLPRLPHVVLQRDQNREDPPVGGSPPPPRTHGYLQVLPAAAAGKILNNEPIIGAYRWTVAVSSCPAPISTFQGNKQTESRMSRSRKLSCCIKLNSSLQTTLNSNILRGRETKGKSKRRKRITK